MVQINNQAGATLAPLRDFFIEQNRKWPPSESFPSISKTSYCVIGIVKL